jgi:hypothetical protein
MRREAVSSRSNASSASRSNLPRTVAGLAVLKAVEALHEVKGRAVDLNRIDRRPALEPLAPTSGIGGTPLPKGGSFLNHGPCRGNDTLHAPKKRN